jgi:hypothetical protein
MEWIHVQNYTLLIQSGVILKMTIELQGWRQRPQIWKIKLQTCYLFPGKPDDGVAQSRNIVRGNKGKVIRCFEIPVRKDDNRERCGQLCGLGLFPKRGARTFALFAMILRGPNPSATQNLVQFIGRNVPFFGRHYRDGLSRNIFEINLNNWMIRETVI